MSKLRLIGCFPCPVQVSSEESRFQRDAVGDSEEVQVRRIDLAFEGTPPLLEGATLRLMPGRWSVISRAKRVAMTRSPKELLVYCNPAQAP